MAVATTMKLSPLAYAMNLPALAPRSRTLYVAILLVGLVVPYFVWENYLYIYRYGNDLKGDAWSTIGALLVAVPFAARASEALPIQNHIPPALKARFTPVQTVEPESSLTQPAARAGAPIGKLKSAGIAFVPDK